MTVYLFGVVAAEADPFLAASNTGCSWPSCSNAAIIGALFKTPHSALGDGLSLSCACTDHQLDLEADTVASWRPMTTTTTTQTHGD